MKKGTLIQAVIATTLSLGVGVAYADFKMPKTKVSMERCMKVALAKYPGTVETMEMELSNGKPHYEFDIRGNDGKEYEVEVSALTGKIIEVETEVEDANDATFQEKAKVSHADAEAAALAAFPGQVVETEYSIESDGNPSYEFDIVTANGKEIEVEVDAVTGKVLEHETEVYQIGKE